MERLTYRIDNIPDGESGVWVEQHDYISAAEKLADYEDAEEQGLLIRLPCKIGETLYFTHDKRVIASEVLSVKYHAEAENHGVFIRERVTIDVKGIPTEIDFCSIGKIVFTTKEDAEAKLKEMESSHDRE